MDPYLEEPALWREFHRGLVANLQQILQPGLIDRYYSAAGQRHFATEAEDYLEVRQRSDGRLVTLLDVVSPANKTTPAGRQAYLDTRREAGTAGANCVEIDLVLQGQPTLEYSRAGLPHWHYAVTVTRATQPERYEIYNGVLEKRLPRFLLPLAADGWGTVLDLQAAFTRCFSEGGYAERIDYARDPPGPLREEDYRWIDEQLTSKRLRRPTPPHEEIARLAYALWEEQGRTDGKDREHWQEALERLRRLDTHPTK
jgi:hypothetical protein